MDDMKSADSAEENASVMACLKDSDQDFDAVRLLVSGFMMLPENP